MYTVHRINVPEEIKYTKELIENLIIAHLVYQFMQ